MKIDQNNINYSVSTILKSLKIETVFELIEKYKRKNKINVIKNNNINVDQLIELDRSGLFSIGAHTMNHPILFNENFDKSKKEIVDSFNLLSIILNHKIKYFAYPNGIPFVDFGDREIDILNNINCKLAFSTESQNFSLNNNPLSIPRYGITYGNKFFIKSKLALNKYWDKIRDINSKSEQMKRCEIIKVIKCKL